MAQQKSFSTVVPALAASVISQRQHSRCWAIHITGSPQVMHGRIVRLKISPTVRAETLCRSILAIEIIYIRPIHAVFDFFRRVAGGFRGFEIAAGAQVVFLHFARFGFRGAVEVMHDVHAAIALVHNGIDDSDGHFGFPPLLHHRAYVKGASQSHRTRKIWKGMAFTVTLSPPESCNVMMESLSVRSLKLQPPTGPVATFPAIHVRFDLSYRIPV